MNIYIDARALQKPHWQGEQVYVHSLIQSMAQIGKDHQLHLHFGWSGWDNRLDSLATLPNIVVHKCPGRFWSQASIALNILRTHSKVYFRMYNEIRPLRVPLPCPAVILVHDLRYLNANVFGPATPAPDSPDRFRHVRRFDHVITVSETVKDEIATLLDVPREKITVAHNAVHHAAATEPQRCPETLPSDADYFLMVNCGGAHKNWRDTLAAYAIYHESALNPTRLVLAGNLHEQAEPIRAFLQSHADIAEDVILLGYVDDAELRYLYAHARILIYPSRYEGFGRPILEAMLFGTPVLISDIPVLREVAGDAAVAVPLGMPQQMAHEMARINLDADLRRSLVERSRVRLTQFSWQRGAAAALNALVSLS